jgi:hypothetical protein
MDGSIVRVERLGPIGARVGSPGGQGTVYELVDHPGWLYKRYHDDLDVDPDGLVALVRWRDGLTGRDQQIVDLRTAWPRCVVAHDDGFGVVFQRAHQRFTHRLEEQILHTDLQFACLDEGAWGGAGPVGPRAAVTIVYRYAQVLDVLHRGGVAYGDLSFTNMFWSAGTPRPHILVIDCDAAWVTSGPRGLPPGETYLWVDPWTGFGSDEARATDLLKLALLFVRTYYTTIKDFLGESTRSIGLKAEPPVSGRVARLLECALAQDATKRRDAAADRWFAPLVAMDRRLEARGRR